MTRVQLKDSPDAKIMIRAANWVGDAIMTTPVIRAVRNNYPNAHITVLAKPWVVPVYAASPHVDEVMVYHNQGRHKMGLGTLRLGRDIKDRKFDLAVLMQNAFEAAFIAWLGNVKERLGFNTDARGILLNRAVKLDKALKKGHLIDYYLAILQGAGLDTFGREMELFIPDTDMAFAKAFLSENRISGPVIGINPGATGGTAKRWFPERFATLARRMADAYDTRVLLFGAGADAGLGDEINALSQNACINMAGKTSLSQAFALISQLDLFVTNDSGLMHAAAALNINQVAVIGSTDVVATSPANANSVMVRHWVDCAPCLKDECPIDHRCMDRVSVDEVFAAGTSFLEGR